MSAVFVPVLSTKKYYRTRTTIEVLSEEPIPAGMEVGDILRECDEGGFVLTNVETVEKELDGKQAADALHEAGSEPAFFRLDDEGNPVDD